MQIVKMEFSKTAYVLDFVIYLIAPVLIFWVLLNFKPHEKWPVIGIVVVVGLFSWTLLEYVLHRFVLHGIAPFKHWHAEHHHRPYALIGTPTVFSLMLLLVGVFLPALLIGGIWRGGGFALGVIIGYAVYSWMHHALHHWRAHTAWLKRHKRLHAIHHHATSECNYGVITSFWDRVFGTHIHQH